ncbi:MAG: undecaprenyl-diphosphate phosphatase, partial [Gammaproteobacteria bacterium]|nr:undecaprenyl-diphosphate phosphatase [Gammaproteobacteria bacterium]
MDVFQAVMLALIQGLTEFLPISSSAHLILPSKLFGWPDQGLAFDVAVHVGTLSAVMLYFRKDIVSMTVGGGRSVVQRRWNPDSRLLLMVVIATIPAGIAGLILNDYVDEYLRFTWIIATTTLIFGLLLWYADTKGARNKKMSEVVLQTALLIGFAQALALIPGTSRSGITITAA